MGRGHRRAIPTRIPEILPEISGESRSGPRVFPKIIRQLVRTSRYIVETQETRLVETSNEVEMVGKAILTMELSSALINAAMDIAKRSSF